jgi:hypothetical protein
MNKKINIKTKKNNNKEIKDILDIIPSYCDKCGAYHDKGMIELIDRNDNLTIVYLMCDNCLTKSILYVVKPLNNMVNKYRLNVDLDSSEIKKFAGKEAISTNDILNVFKVIKDKKYSKADDFIKKISNA